MKSHLLYLKDPLSSRFVGGGLAEVESLFGTPLPPLPTPEVEGGSEAYFVHFHPHLRTLLQRYIEDLLTQIAPGALGGKRPDAGAKVSSKYEAALKRTLTAARAADRRQGLANLFWLAHTKELVDCVKQMEKRSPEVRKLKYSLFPLLAPFYQRLDESARREVERLDPERASFLVGGREDVGLVDALIGDGFALTEGSISEFDFNQFLASNKRYRLSPDLFFEIYSVLARETERRLRDGDRGLLARAARHVPGLPRSQYQTPAGTVKLLMCAPIMSYLLADAWNVGSRLTASPKLRAGCERQRPEEIVDAFLELVAGVKRFEILCHVRDRIVLLQAFGGDRELEEKTRQAFRLYEFGEAAQIVNNAVNATVLFLDLRGFTKTSEGQISERDLTSEIYTVFDAFIPIVERFGGTVDKFLGDGIMVTYGADHADPLAPLNALRTAIVCQATLRRLREESKTYFKMGVAVHYGRAYVARFIAGSDSVHTTLIGRTVNLAGRLSSGAKAPTPEEEAQPQSVPVLTLPSGLSVFIDPTGALQNEGIVLSRETLGQLEALLPLGHANGVPGGRMEYLDDQIGRRIQIRYVGDAKFKGVRSSFPVYEADYED
jgi:class 3 adenylate cyclase